jgi:uncharacterized protein YbjT (DUF2867 family)
VRALVRHPDAPAARRIESLGATLVQADLDDPSSLAKAVAGAGAVFSVPVPEPADPMSMTELIRSRHLIRAAERAGVHQFVHTSVFGAGMTHTPLSGRIPGDWERHYWTTKAAVDDEVRNAGFASWTVLKPATFMENLTGPSFLFGNPLEDGLRTAYAPHTRIALVAVDDIGRAGTAVLRSPQHYHSLDLDLVGDRLTATRITDILSATLQRHLPAPVLNRAKAMEFGISPAALDIHERTNEQDTPGNPDLAPSLGLQFMDLRTWLSRSRSDLPEARGSVLFPERAPSRPRPRGSM